MSSDMSHGQGYRISPKLDSASPPADPLFFALIVKAKVTTPHPPSAL